jgi:hypothetical protein
MKDASEDLSQESRTYGGKKPSENEEANEADATTKEWDGRCNENEKKM